MAVTINGTTGVTYPAGGTDNVAGAGVGTTDAQTLSNKTITAANSNTVEATSGPTSTQLAGQRNKIINGAMMIDQRNAGASVTPTTNGTYTVDRWKAWLNVSSKFSVQQNAGSVTPPVGFINYLGVTSLSSYSVASGDFTALGQSIEGLNCADLAWGTAGAKTVTLSFQVYSSLTGTFGGSLCNNAGSRSYPFTYSIASANTWTSVSVQIPGDTSGTWLKDNSTGINLFLSLGTGSTWTGTAGSWAGAYYLNATGATSVVGTNGATFYITGVQLEKGTTATPFENRLYGTELALCQRYYEELYAYGIPMSNYNTVNAYGNISYYIKRIPPTVTLTGSILGNYYSNNSGLTITSRIAQSIYDTNFQFRLDGVGFTQGCAGHYDFANGKVTLSAEL